ncbi:MAG TPA: hypothetical protein VK153_03010 [Candidatus Paceibacterota bacterium]|nr:hypothetical protein [Candidatus Paceibacterota bacterium]
MKIKHFNLGKTTKIILNWFIFVGVSVIFVLVPILVKSENTVVNSRIWYFCGLGVYLTIFVFLIYKMNKNNAFSLLGSTLSLMTWANIALSGISFIGFILHFFRFLPLPLQAIFAWPAFVCVPLLLFFAWKSICASIKITEGIVEDAISPI